MEQLCWVQQGHALQDFTILGGLNNKETDIIHASVKHEQIRNGRAGGI